MLKIYLYKGRKYQFEEKEAPAGAVLVETKKATPKNKARATKTKKG